MKSKTVKNDYASYSGAQKALKFFVCILTAGLISLGMLALLALVAVKLNMPKTAVVVAVNAIYALGVTICGIFSARRASRGGLLCGAGVGVLYAVLLYLIGCAVAGQIAFSAAALSGVCAALICGGIGGVIGINMKKR